MRFPWSSTSRRRQYKPLLQVPFVGRQAVLTALATHLQAAQNGALQCVTLTGQAGSGKSALLEEFVYLHCSKPGVLLLQLNAADCLLDYDVYRQLCTALQNHSEQILQKVYNATQRVRKTLALHWDEAEFRQVLASTDWAQPHEASRRTPSVPGAASTPLAPLLASVQEHPWAIGAAAILGVSGRGIVGGTMQRVWEQRWLMFLRALRARHRPGEAVIVLVIDQVPPSAPAVTPEGRGAVSDWQTFTTLTAAEQLPLLIMWAGPAAGLQPLHQALRDAMPLTEYQIEPLVDEDQQRFIRQAVRGLPRGLQTPWSQALTAAGDITAVPGWCLLATTCAAAASQPPDVHSLASLVQADLAALVSQLVEAIRQRHPVQAPLFRQVLEACAFMPPGKQLVVDDLLPLCDFAGLDLDPATGRSYLEILLGQCTRYGLLRYDPYAARYTLGHSAIQEALQGLVYPDVSARQQMARQRRLAAALLHHVQQGERVGLAALAEHIKEAYGGAARELLTPLVVVPFRRLLPTCTREERQRIATTLGGFASALAVDLIRCLVHDEDGQVRSSAVQSLADLAREEAVPVLLEALQDSNSDVRWIATRALGQRPGSTAVDALIPMLTDEDKEVGRIAAEGLGLQGDRRAVPHLIAALRESYPLLRESAILALGQLADQRAIPALQDVLHDANQQVRRSAEVALARFAASAGG
jgi:hypothetical protein